MSAKKIPITPIFKDLPTVAQVVAMSTATIERLEREGQFPSRRFAGNSHPSPNRSLRRSTTFSARPNSGTRGSARFESRTPSQRKAFVAIQPMGALAV